MTELIKKRHREEEEDLKRSHKRRCVEIEALERKKKALKEQSVKELKEMRARHANEIKEHTKEILDDEDTLCVGCKKHKTTFVTLTKNFKKRRFR